MINLLNKITSLTDRHCSRHTLKTIKLIYSISLKFNIFRVLVGAREKEMKAVEKIFQLPCWSQRGALYKVLVKSSISPNCAVKIMRLKYRKIVIL